MESPATTSQSASPEQMMDVEVKEEPDELQDFYFDADGSLLPKEETDPIYGDYQNPNDTADIDDKDDLDLDDDKKSDLDLDEDRKSDLDLDDDKKSDQDPSEQEIDTKKASLPAGLCVIETKEDTINNILMANVVKTKIFLAKGTLFGPFPDLNPSASVKPSKDGGSKSNGEAGELSNLEIVRKGGVVYYKIARDIQPEGFKDQAKSTAKSTEIMAKKKSPAVTKKERRHKSWKSSSVMDIEQTSGYQRKSGIMTGNSPSEVDAVHCEVDQSQPTHTQQLITSASDETMDLVPSVTSTNTGKIVTQNMQPIGLVNRSPLTGSLIHSMNVAVSLNISKTTSPPCAVVPNDDSITATQAKEIQLPEVVSCPLTGDQSSSLDASDLLSCQMPKAVVKRRRRPGKSIKKTGKIEPNPHEPHDKKETPNVLHRCPSCMKNFTSVSGLMTHFHESDQCKTDRKPAIPLKPTQKPPKSVAKEKFDCDTCNKTFSSKRSLASHNKYLHSEPLKCPMCDKTFPTRTRLWKHKVSDHLEVDANKAQEMTTFGPPKKTHSCSHCDQVFDTIGDLRLHVVEHTGVMPFQCNHCDKGFLEKFLLKQHMYSHDKNKRFKCSICDKGFRDRQQLNVHERFHKEGRQPRKSNPKDKLCSDCGNFFTRRSIGRHLLTHKEGYGTDAERKYECSQCGKRFKTKYHLQDHEGTHGGRQGYPCPDCGKVLARKNSLVEHQARMHSSVREHRCNFCRQSFTLLKDLKSHMKTHEEAQSAQCHTCGKFFNCKKSLRRHLRSMHGGTSGRNFFCFDCGKSYVSQCDLKYHLLTHKYSKIRETAKKEHTVKCSECPMTFPSQTNLHYHMLKHTGEKPHQCSDCGKSFSLLGNLKTHKRTHTGEKPFKCTACDMSFQKKVQLLLHMETHTVVENQDPK